ncbi:uncharacterized protein Bfra_000641 [Botrytis fragariae]|uniref:Uncharacterized protein n=1 Tax=Botrytis fragariae TaxID=1964551 RepID=A0A8H6ENK4_9HELO|nr:uncharacterized protein Bfra_000641 [Botrytis fragariae]KAF5878475.1 hypothetical protein Bfra_000641 [Botrytis fragariae]
MAAVSAKSPLKRVGLSQGAVNGVQSIVNLQFRKEHRSLFTLLEDLRTKVDKASADAERRFEESQKQLKDTESRLEKLEDESRAWMQMKREWEGEVTSLKEKMESASGLMCLPATSAEQLQPISQSVSALSPEINTCLLDRNPRTPNRRQSSQAISPLAHDGPMSPPPPPRLPLPATTPTKKIIPPLLSKPLPNATSRKAARPPSWINISQTPYQTIEDYLAHATERHQAIKSRKSRFEFIARFIRGLLNEKDRDALLKQLQKEYQSRTTKDGFVEVLCGFSDVGEGLLAAGLIAGSGGTSGKRGGHDAGMDHGEVDASHQKRRKTLESQLSNDDEL